MRHARIIAPVAAALLLLAGLAAAKPQAPIQLSGLFTRFLQSEDQIEGGEWDAAAKTVEAMGEQFAEVRKILAGTVDGQTLEGFRSGLAELRKAVAARDEGAALKRHVALQGRFLSLMESFEFRKPPAVSLALRYLAHAREALEKGNWRDVVGELGEIAELMPRVGPALASKGFSKGDVDAFAARVKTTKRDAEAKKSKETAAGLGELRGSLEKALGE